MVKLKRTATAAVAAAALIGPIALVSPAYAGANNNSVKKLTKALTVAGVLDYLEAFQATATAIITFAFDTSTVNGATSPGKSHGKAKGNAKQQLDQFKNRYAK